ncbi:hypothetical protein H5P28_09080 [Ruficoccus amylovorans]|uniref:Aerotolerance regulator N-terminal domain-containing protein n=1 Tax=Ruficoccus amylovorans TaxID=1804625 RepID=A0A842HEE0_9BACT|nr:hypothetical protein [Ruficoccus amylovorans]MBC2594408.1 hypothetical protein [Ruficoccus amylovorans]
MHLILSNPPGWWGLLMLPALVLIHCLHRNRQPLIISTLFLVQRGSNERHGGRKFVFWRHSVTFWLQVLAALLITWLLLQPRWIGEQTRQRIALVLDSSLSMDAFRPELLEALREQTQTLSGTAAQTDWLLMESDPRAPVLYRGEDRQELLRLASEWQPTLGVHDPSGALATVRALVGPEGAVIFVTDHPPDAPDPKLAVLSAGRPLDNAGFAGVQVGMRNGEALWRTLLKNYSDQPVERRWWIEINGEQTEPRLAALPANGHLELAGAMPHGVKSLTLVLEDDAWPIDNRLPLVWPEPMRIAYLVQTGDPAQSTALRALFKSLGETYHGTLEGRTDLLVAESSDLNHLPGDIVHQVLFAPTTETSTLPAGAISVEDHPLNEGLNWNTLTVRGGVTPAQLGPGETPLVWLGGTPLIWTREHPQGRDLVFNFSLRDSNALKLPATVLLAGRFVEQLRDGKPGPRADNFELGQALSVSLPADIRDLRVNGEPAQASGHLRLNAPTRPGSLEVTADDTLLLRGAAHFADIREADLRGAAAYSDITDTERRLITMNSEADAWQLWWVLLLTGVMLAGWHYAERGR